MLVKNITAEHVFLACGHTDMRKSIDGLAAIVQQNFKLDPFSKDVFMFCGRRKDRIKALFWDGDGFSLLYKRLDNGKFCWPKSPNCFLQYLFTQSCRVIWRILHRQKGDFCSTSKLPIANEFFRRHSFFCFFACSLSLQLRIISSEPQYIKNTANRLSGKSLTY